MKLMEKDIKCNPLVTALEQKVRKSTPSQFFLWKWGIVHDHKIKYFLHHVNFLQISYLKIKEVQVQLLIT